MPKQSPNGPISLPAASYGFTQLKTALDTALLAPDDDTRYAQVQNAIVASQVLPGVVTPQPSVTLSSALVKVEGNTGTTTFNWILTLVRNGSTDAYTYAWNITGFGANPANAADFGGLFPAGTGTFAPGETVKSIPVLVTGDTSYEPDDTFLLSVSVTGVGNVTSTGTISNDDAAPALPTVSISAAQSIAEGNSGATLFTYTVSRSASSGATTVPWTFASGTTSADDFTGGTFPAGGTVALADGVSTGTFTVSVAGDTAFEPDEIFTVSIQIPSGYAAGSSLSATGTIVNDDAAGSDTQVNSVSRIAKPGTQSNSAPTMESAPAINTLQATSTRASIIDPLTTYQVYEGVGVQLQHATQFNLNKLPAATKDQVLDNAFGVGKMNFIRAYLGSGAFLAIYKQDGAADYSTLTGPLSDTTPQDASLPGFTMDRQMLETGDIVKLALAKNPQARVFLTCASPPAYMKTGYNTTQLDNTGKLATGTGGAFNTAYYQHYANYMVRGMQEMIARGIPIYSVAVQNEPANNGTYPTCTWTALQIATFIRDFLWPAMGVANLQYVQVWSGEVNLVDATKYVDAINDVTGLSGIIKGASYHNYSGPMTNIRFSKYPNIGHHITEWRTLLTDNNTSTIGSLWGNMIMGAFRAGAASSSMFVLALDETGAPSTNNLNRRGVVTVQSDGSGVKYNQEFYMLTQVAKYTQPGGRRIDSNTGGGINNVAFLNPNGTTTVHFFNSSSSVTRTTDVVDAVSGKTFPITLLPLESVSMVMQNAAVTGAKAQKLTGLQAFGADTQVTLQWAALTDSNRKAITVLRRTGTADFVPIAVLKPGDTTYVDTTTATGTLYDFTIQAIGNGRADRSDTASATTSGAVAPVLGQITMTFATPPRIGVANTITIAGRTAGSTVTIVTNEGQTLDASSGSVAWTPQAVGPDGLTPTETLATAANPSFTSDPTAVDVLPAQTSLQNLTITFPAQPKVGVETTGTIVGATAGSTITVLTQGGTTIVAAANRTFKYTPTTAGDRTLTPTETLEGAVINPYTSPATTVNVAAAGAAPAFLDTYAGTAGTSVIDRLSDSGHGYKAQPGVTAQNHLVGSGVAYAPNVASPGAWNQLLMVPTSADYQVDATVKVASPAGATSGVTVYLRGGEATDTGYTMVYNSFSGAWTLQKRNAGTNSTLGTITKKLAAGGSGVMSLAAKGKMLTFMVDGAVVGTYEDTTFASAGFISIKQTGTTTSPTSGATLDRLEVNYI